MPADPPVPLRRSRITIDLDALAANYDTLRRQAGGRHPAGVVKADAYGLGVEPVVRRLEAEGCDRFFVARLDEGLAVRRAVDAAGGPQTSGSSPEVLVFDGVTPGSEDELVATGLVPVVNDLGQLERWRAAARSAGRRLPVALHFDTGMTRLGIPAAEADRLADRPDLLDGLDVGVVMSHLASADVPDSDQSAEQLDRFRKLRDRFEQGSASLANSAGVFLGPEYHFDLVRPGIGLYGGRPLPGTDPNPMRTVVTVEAPIVQVQDVDAGTPVGYGATHRCPTRTRLATVPIGYADGFLRSAGRQRWVGVGEHLAPVVGRVSMDLISVDVGHLPEEHARPGTPVQLLGPTRPVDAVASEAGTIAYEILTGLSRRCERVLRGAGGGG